MCECSRCLAWFERGIDLGECIYVLDDREDRVIASAMERDLEKEERSIHLRYEQED